MRTRILKHALSAAPLVGLLASTEVLAFKEVARPFAPTPARIIRTAPEHEGAKESALIRSLGMRVTSWRADGSPALLWSVEDGAPSSLTKGEAEERALSIAQSLAAVFGVAPGDLFVQGSVEFDAGFVSVTIGQRWQGIDVDRGILVHTFVQGRLAAIRNDLVLHRLTSATPGIAIEEASAVALDAAKRIAKDSRLSRAPVLEIWTSSDRAEDARLAYRVHTASFAPRSELDLFVDANTGRILAADDEVRYANGEGRLHITVHDVNQQAAAVPFTGKFFGLGANAHTDGDGDAQLQGPVSVTYSGPYAVVQDQSGAQLEQLQAAFGGPFHVISLTPTNFSQADPFVHTNVAKAYDQLVMPNNTILFQQIPVNVNLQQTCNAYFDGQSINFFIAGNGCANTGEIATVVMHEFGHAVHLSLSTQQPDGAVGEGTADFHAGHIASDPIIGRGFMPGTTGGIRALDQPKVYPTDLVGEIHADGRIWATALWEFRVAMIAKYGDWEGKRVTYNTFLKALTQNPTLATAYPAIIAGDADVANSTSGTPNSCELNPIFQRHGLVNGGNLNHTLAPTRSFVRINHDAPGKFVAQNGAITISATAENRSTCGTFNLNDMKLYVAPGMTQGTYTQVPLTFANNAASAQLTQFNAGDTFRYYFTIVGDGITYTNGTDTAPNVGVVSTADRVDAFREGFENGLGMWTHGSVGSDLVDDWEAGAPQGLAYDPYQAHEGMKVAGTDLGGAGGAVGTDGVAKAGRHTFLQAPPIATTGKQDVRLELWQHFAINGTLTISVDGTQVYTYTGDGTKWSQGWRFLSIPLGDAAKDKSSITVRFEATTGAQNIGGGWSIDDVAVTGVAIPPPVMMPPPMNPPPMNPPPMNPPPNNNPPGMNPGDNGMTPTVPTGTPANPQTPATNPTPQDPGAEPSPRGAGSFSGSVNGGCTCLAPKSRAGATPLLVAGLALALWARRRRAT